MSRKIGENHNIFTDTAVNLPPPKGGFAVGGNMNINELNDYERGEYDCILGYPALEGQSEAYELGYGEQYQKEETVGGQHEFI
jgi:hypothetical protein